MRMSKKDIFQELQVGKFCTYIKYHDTYGFVVSHSYEIKELDKATEMVSFIDPIDNALTDFYGKHFCESWYVNR